VAYLKTGLFRLALAVLAPACVVAAGEGILRWMGVESAAPLIRVADERGAHWTSNPAYGRSIFPQEAGPALPPLWVPDGKAAGDIRIVVLGESAAEGFPLSEFNLARVLETVVAERNPALRVRAISLAMTGINSHQIRRLGLAAARCLDPDVVVLYAGNNEAIGPHGPAAVLPGWRRCLPLIRLQDAVREGRLAQALDRGLRRVRAAQGQSGTWRGLDEFRGVEIAADDPRLASTYRHFEANVDDLVSALTRRGIRVAICTMGVNLNDWPPLGSEPPTEAAAPPEMIRSAAQAYRTAETLAQAGERSAAWPWWRRACDLDLIRFRADSRINGALRARGAAGPADRVRLVDVDRALHEDDPGGGDDRRWFYEHVHLTLPGRIAVAGQIADALSAAGWVAAPRRASADEVADVQRALAFAPADEARALSGIRDMYRWPLFAEQMHARERMADLENRIQAQQAEWAQWDVARLRSQWDEIRRRRPVDGWAAQLLGDHLLALGDAAAALAASEAALEANPTLNHARANAARAGLRLGRMERAREHAEIGLQREPDDPELLAVRGEAALRDRHWPEAERDLAQAHRLRPKDLGVIIDLARLAEARGEARAAEAHYRQGLDISPKSAHLLNNLALLRLADPAGSDEALALATRAAEVDPESPYVWLTLARAQNRRGDGAAANEALACAERWAAESRDSHLLEALAQERKQADSVPPAPASP